MASLSGLGDTDNVIDIAELKKYSFEIGAIRPPSEGGSFSLLLRVSRNCPWSRCTFCYARFYKREKFELRSVEEIKADIDSVKAISDELEAISRRLGFNGELEPIGAILQPSLLYRQAGEDIGEAGQRNISSVINVYNWLVAGSRTVFLQDADTLIMYTDQLIEVIRYLKEVFPAIERITSYARSKTIVRKKPEELAGLQQAGLTRLHIGLETGDDELLRIIDKGVTAEEHILAGKKALEAGFQLSEYVMPGLGGRKMSEQHARNTARVLNEINPHFIRFRPFIPSSHTPLLESYRRGEFELTSPHERLREIRLFIDNLEVSSGVCFDHNLNPSYRTENGLTPLLKQDYDGYKFPGEKAAVLELIDKGLQMDEKVFADVRDSVGTDRL